MVLARRLAAAGEIARAAEAYQAYLDRPDGGDSSERDAARFELARCLRKSGRLAPAARTLSELTDKTADAALARRAVEEAVEAWRAVVAEAGLGEGEVG